MPEPLVTRESVETELTDLGTKARRGGRMHRDYLEWHGRINILLDTWRQLVLPPVAPPVTFSNAEVGILDPATLTDGPTGETWGPSGGTR